MNTRTCEEIIEYLYSKSNKKAKESYIKFVKTSKVIGVYNKDINKQLTKWKKEISFDDIRCLWKSGHLEPRSVAIKLLGKIGKKYPEKTIDLIKEFSEDLEDWATTDTLATQGVRGIINLKYNELKTIALEKLNSDNIWEVRFGIVFFINNPHDDAVEPIIKRFEKSKEYYIKKAIAWLKRERQKAK